MTHLTPRVIAMYQRLPNEALFLLAEILEIDAGQPGLSADARAAIRVRQALLDTIITERTRYPQS